MRCYSHLSDDEREQIGLARTLGHSIGTIAQAIGRPKSTISRELSRNKLPSGRYSPLHAAGAYQLRRRREALIERDRALRTFVVDRLAEGWTPEQISGWLKAGNELGRVKTKSDLVVMPSGRQIFAFFCSPHDRRAQNSGCGHTA